MANKSTMRSSARNSPSKKSGGNQINSQSHLLSDQPSVAPASKPVRPKKRSNALDFNAYISEMIQEKSEEPKAPLKKFHVFKKKPHLSIADMQSKTKHVVHNKISDKFNRRDVQYYDLYALQEPEADYHKMREEGYPYTKAEAKIKEFYGDLAFPDFNTIFKSQGNIIGKQYGQTINVSLNVSKRPEGGLRVSRVVKEDMTKKVTTTEIQTQKKNKISYSEDKDL